MKKKRLLSLVMAVALLFGSAAALPEGVFDDGTGIVASAASTATSGKCGENIKWVLTDDGVLTISGTGKMTDYKDYSSSHFFNRRTKIKSVIIEPGVTSIGNYAFYDCDIITSIIIPDSVTSIGHDAFSGCTKLTSITIPDSVTSIGYDAFRYCSKLERIDIPSSVTSIGHYAFSGTQWLNNQQNINPVVVVNGILIDGTKCSGNVTIPNSVTNVGHYAFSGCTKLTSITIPDSVTSIGACAFSGCTNLLSITIPDSVTSVGDSAFSGCRKLTGVTLPNSVISISYKMFSNCTSVISINIPDSVTSIDDYAFSGCTKLTSITIPDSVTSIGKDAFSGTQWLNNQQNINPVVVVNGILIDGTKCSGNVTIPNSVTIIGGYAFSYCSKLSSITIPDSVTSIGNYAFSNCKNLSSITIPDSVTSIGNYAFWGCTNLSSITIPDSVTSIDDHAFSGCTKLTRITIPDSVTSIGNYAFSGCTNLSSITIPDSVTSIGDCAFSKTNISSIVIPASVKEIGSDAFGGCPLSYVRFQEGVTKIGATGFENVSKISIPVSVTSINDNLYYNNKDTTIAGSRGSYAEKFASKMNYRFVIEGYDYNKLGYSTASIKSYNGYDRSLKLPSNLGGYSITGIEEGAFNFCSNITSITIPNSISFIGNNTFKSCPNLSRVSISNSVSSIGNDVFSNCPKLTDIDVDPKNRLYSSVDGIVYSKDQTTIIRCPSGKTSITIPDSVTSIGDYAFSGCTNLSSITIPDSVTSIGDYAFSGCTKLTSITIPDSIKSIGNNAFNGCSSLNSITIPNTLNIIEDGTFSDCTSLNSVNIPQSVTSIGKEAFKNTGLISVTIPYGLTSIKSSAFYHCRSLTDVYIPSSVSEIGSDAFICCPLLKSVTIPKTVTSIGSHAFGYEFNENTYNYYKVSGFKIYCIEGSAAEEYAKNNGFEYEYFICKHDYATSVIAPTCTEKGYTKNICKHCGNVIINPNSYVDALDHDYSDIKVIAPTCTEKGYTVHTCTRCGDQKKFDYVDALGHNYVDTVTPPNCTEKGYTTHTCTRCDYSYKDKYTNPVADAHVYGDWIITFETTDTICGSKERFCKLCKHRDVLIDHDKEYVKTVAPTCTENGYTVYNCARCGAELHENIVDAKGHKWAAKNWSWNSNYSNAWLNFICDNDNTHTKYEYATITSKTVQATCTTNGKTDYTATLIYEGKTYQDYKTKALYSTGHSWGEPSWRWDGNKAYATFVCSKDSSHTQTLTANVTTDSLTSATCTSNGSAKYTASVTVNGKKYTDTNNATVQATGHKWSDWRTTLNPTCSYNGEKERTCSACGQKETQTINKSGHTYEKTVVYPTMYEGGYTTYKCSVCGYSYKGDYKSAATSGKCGDNLTWTFSNGKLTISGTGSMYNWDPNNNKNSPFTSDKITSIVIGNGVTSIGNWAFNGCTKLKSVSIPATVKTIGEGAFQNCYLLSSVAIPNGVTSIGDGAFWCCSNLSSVTLPSSLRTIGYLAFGGCTRLNSISIPYGVNTIAEAAFSGSNNLTSISIPSTVKSIGARAFDSTKWLSTMRSKNPLVVVNGLLVDAQTYKGATLTLSSSIKGICGCAFSECKNLTSITIPSSVTRIGNDAFYNCTKLKSIVIPNSVQSIEDFTFYGCTSLSSVTIGSGVKSIGYSAFYGTQNLKSITIPASVGTIDKYALGYYYDSKTQKAVKVSGFTISGYTGSAAEKYAKDNGFKFVSKGTHTHSYTNTVVPATCKDKGYTVHTCKTCGYSYTDSYTAVNNNAHRFGAWSVSANASTSTNGSLKRTCSLCGTTETSPYVYYSRIAGQNRFATAAAVSRASFASADTVVLAFGLNYADALAGVPLATKLNAPILLTYKDSLPSETLTEIKRLGAKNIVILGGTGAISTTVENQLVSNGIIRSRITRYAGSSRYGTATSVAKALNSKPTELFFVYAGNSADALSVSVIAAVKGAPIIYLKTNGTLDDATKAYLASVKGYVKRAYVIGGTGVISDAMKKLADNALGITSKRLYGKDRYETCVAVNNEFKSLLTSKSICIATGLDYPDALAGGVLAALNKSPLFLINGKISLLTLSDTQKNLIKSRKPSNINVFGGTGAVSENSILTVSAECAKS